MKVSIRHPDGSGFCTLEFRWMKCLWDIILPARPPRWLGVVEKSEDRTCWVMA